MNTGQDIIMIPDSRLAHEITEIVRDTASELLFNHSSRVYLFGALAGQRRGLGFDPELLYAGAIVPRHGSDQGPQQRHRTFRG